MSARSHCPLRGAGGLLFIPGVAEEGRKRPSFINHRSRRIYIHHLSPRAYGSAEILSLCNLRSITFSLFAICLHLVPFQPPLLKR
jgi:hypothetical protein